MEYDFNYLKAAKAAGRKITAIGGGTGLSTLLLGLKEYTENITAIVTVTDDGGGSGMIRQEFGMLPPGDIRNCILALADTTSTLSNVLSYRFTEGSLKGQSFGNLFLLALNNITGSFDGAVAVMNDILAVTGKVLPVTTGNIILKATFEDGSVVNGETAITRAKKRSGLAISKVDISPKAQALPDAISAIEEADIIVLGPGSLYTSIIPNLMVGGVAEAIQKSKALKVYILNIMTQEGETEGFTALQHVNEINAHAGSNIIDACIFNSKPIRKKLRDKYETENSTQLFPDKNAFEELGIILCGDNLLSPDFNYVRHDPLRLAWSIMDLGRRLRPREDILAEYDNAILEIS